MAEWSRGTGLKFWWRQNVGSNPNRGGHGASSFGWDVKPQYPVYQIIKVPVMHVK